MTKSIRVGVVEDHPLYLEMLRSGLESQPGIEVAFAATSTADARRQFGNAEVDAVLLDIDLPDGNGIGLGESLRRAQPRLGVVLLSNMRYPHVAREAESHDRAGWSYVLKSTIPSLDYLADVIRATVKGDRVIDEALNHADRSVRPTLRDVLTQRQFEILALVAEGLSNRDIGAALGITDSSVINHLTDIYRLLGIPSEANSRVAAVLRYFEDRELED